MAFPGVQVKLWSWAGSKAALHTLVEMWGFMAAVGLDVKSNPGAECGFFTSFLPGLGLNV